MKRPSFQFYPSDWLRDAALRCCSVGARGLWMDMLCYMHEGTPYGYLKVNHKVILNANLSRMCGLTLEEIEGYLEELISAGVCQKDDDGALFSKRMIRDENLRNIRAAGGKLGGNPLLNKVEERLTLEVKQKSTPSSSSSSSKIKTETKPRAKALDCPQDVEQQVWNDWLHLRKTKRAPVTETTLSEARKEASKAYMTLDNFLRVWCRRGSQGLEASWLKPSEIIDTVDKFAGAI